MNRASKTANLQHVVRINRALSFVGVHANLDIVIVIVVGVNEPLD